MNIDELNKLKASLDLLSEALLELKIKKSKKEYDVYAVEVENEEE